MTPRLRSNQTTSPFTTIAASKASLTEQQQWARRYVDKRGAIAVDDVTDVVTALAPPERIHAADRLGEQLVMDLA